MKEHEYLAVANLIRLRIIRGVLRDLLLPDKLVGEIATRVDVLIERLEPVVEGTHP